MPFMFGGMMDRNGQEGEASMASIRNMEVPVSEQNPPSAASAAEHWINALGRQQEKQQPEPNTCLPGANNQCSSKTSARPLAVRGSGLLLAMRDVSESVMEYLESEEWKDLRHWMIWNVLVPSVAAILVLGCLLFLLHKIYRWYVPYTAPELHHQALQTLQPTRGIEVLPPSTPKTRKQALQQRERQDAEKSAESLWKQALERDPSYDPAWTSLSALYTYRQESPGKALDLLNERGKRQQSPGKPKPLTPDMKAIKADAQAIQQGHKSMVQSDLAETEYLTILAALARSK